MSNAAVAGMLSSVALVLAVYVSRPWRWFSLHPLLMLFGFVGAGLSGIAAKRKGGRINTLIHGYSMLAAFTLSLGGWYVIREQKVMLGKPHNTTLHAYIGLLALAGYGLGAIGGLIALHPDFGVARTNTRFRLVHKLSSRAATGVALAAIATGWYKLTGIVTTSLLGGLLLLLALLLLSPIKGYGGYEGIPLFTSSTSAPSSPPSPPPPSPPPHSPPLPPIA